MDINMDRFIWNLKEQKSDLYTSIVRSVRSLIMHAMSREMCPIALHWCRTLTKISHRLVNKIKDNICDIFSYQQISSYGPNDKL